MSASSEMERIKDAIGVVISSEELTILLLKMIRSHYHASSNSVIAGANSQTEIKALISACKGQHMLASCFTAWINSQCAPFTAARAVNSHQSISPASSSSTSASTTPSSNPSSMAVMPGSDVMLGKARVNSQTSAVKVHAIDRMHEQNHSSAPPPPQSADAGVREAWTLGGLPVRVKPKLSQSAAKKRLTPTTITTLTSADVQETGIGKELRVQGNILQAGAMEAMITTASMKLPAKPIHSVTLPSATTATMSSGSSWQLCPSTDELVIVPLNASNAPKPDLAIIRRVSEIFCCLVQQQLVSVIVAIEFISKLVCLPLTAPGYDLVARAVLHSTVSTANSVSDKTASTSELLNMPSVIIMPAKCTLSSQSAIHMFGVKSLALLGGFVRCMGAELPAILAVAPAVKMYAPSLASDLHYVSEETKGTMDIERITLPDTFIRPFRPDIDSRLEYKSPEENAIYNERERCFDEFSNLLSKFMEANKSDLHGGKVREMLQTLPEIGRRILDLRDCNFSWFADIFVKMLLFHGPNSVAAPALQMPSQPSSRSATAGTDTDNGTGTDRHAEGRSDVTNIASEHLPPAPEQKHLKTTAPGDGVVLKATIPESHPPIPGRTELAAAVVADTSNELAKQNVVINGTVFYTNTRNVPSAFKQRQLEGRLGVGGQVGPQAGQATRHHQDNIKSASYAKPGQSAWREHAQSRLSTPTDIYAEPSGHFPGILNIFFRFIILTDSHRFSKALEACLTAEIVSLVGAGASNKAATTPSSTDSGASRLSHSPMFNKVDSNPDASFDFEETRKKGNDLALDSDSRMDNDTNVINTNNNDMDPAAVSGQIPSVATTGQPTADSRFLRRMPPTFASNTGRDSNMNMNLNEPFSLKVLKLKILGRFLGLVMFWSTWTLSGHTGSSITAAASNIVVKGPLQVLADEHARHRVSMKHALALPLKELLVAAWNGAYLSLQIPWVCEYLKMASWDISFSTINPYIDAITYMKAIQYSDLFHHSALTLSSNRLHILLELQALWNILPGANPNARSAHSAQGLTAAALQMKLSSATYGENAFEMPLDDLNTAFSRTYTRFCLPYFEEILVALKRRLVRAGSVVTKTIDVGVHHNALGTSLSSEISPEYTTESIVAAETLSRPKPVHRVTPTSVSSSTAISVIKMAQTRNTSAFSPFGSGTTGNMPAIAGTNSASTGNVGDNAINNGNGIISANATNKPISTDQMATSAAIVTPPEAHYNSPPSGTSRKGVRRIRPSTTGNTTNLPTPTMMRVVSPVLPLVPPLASTTVAAPSRPAPLSLNSTNNAQPTNSSTSTPRSKVTVRTTATATTFAQSPTGSLGLSTSVTSNTSRHRRFPDGYLPSGNNTSGTGMGGSSGNNYSHSLFSLVRSPQAMPGLDALGSMRINALKTMNPGISMSGGYAGSPTANASLFMNNEEPGRNSTIRDHLEIAFWQQHPQLLHISTFLLDHCQAACHAHLKERVATAVRHFWEISSHIRTEIDMEISALNFEAMHAMCVMKTTTVATEAPSSLQLNNHSFARWVSEQAAEFENTFHDRMSAALSRTHSAELSEGHVFVEEFLSTRLDNSLNELMSLYPGNERVQAVAIQFAKGQSQMQRYALMDFMHSYLRRKLTEVSALSMKQFQPYITQRLDSAGKHSFAKAKKQLKLATGIKVPLKDVDSKMPSSNVETNDEFISASISGDGCRNKLTLNLPFPGVLPAWQEAVDTLLASLKGMGQFIAFAAPTHTFTEIPTDSSRSLPALSTLDNDENTWKQFTEGYSSLVWNCKEDIIDEILCNPGERILASNVTDINTTSCSVLPTKPCKMSYDSMALRNKVARVLTNVTKVINAIATLMACITATSDPLLHSKRITFLPSILYHTTQLLCRLLEWELVARRQLLWEHSEARLHIEMVKFFTSIFPLLLYFDIISESEVSLSAIKSRALSMKGIEQRLEEFCQFSQRAMNIVSDHNIELQSSTSFTYSWGNPSDLLLKAVECSTVSMPALARIIVMAGRPTLLGYYTQCRGLYQLKPLFHVAMMSFISRCLSLSHDGHLPALNSKGKDILPIDQYAIELQKSSMDHNSNIGAEYLRCAHLLRDSVYQGQHENSPAEFTYRRKARSSSGSWWDSENKDMSDTDIQWPVSDTEPWYTVPNKKQAVKTCLGPEVFVLLNKWSAEMLSDSDKQS